MPSVLVVEDDDLLRDALIEWFKADGIDAASATNGREGLDYLSRSPLPCLIVLDALMPGFNGLELLLEIRNNKTLAPIPVAIMSADREALAATQRLGATYVLGKPIDYLVLTAIVARHCR